MWRTEVPITAGQLRGRRDTFWETAPAYDGRREIWDALKAAAEAAEEEDYELAQAILSGANITLPRGVHTHWLCRYVCVIHGIPVQCITPVLHTDPLFPIDTLLAVESNSL